MAEPGPRNLITDVPGILVGQAEDHTCISGTTVILAERPAVAAVDVRGGAPGSRETELLDTGTLVERVDVGGAVADRQNDSDMAGRLVGDPINGPLIMRDV